MDAQEEGTQRKRPRLEDTDAGDGVAETSASVTVQNIQEPLPLVRDELYYREDGDCVILVENVLFKVHRFLLERDLSAFANMFSMPQGESASSLTLTDENPLVLHDDVDDFRALCWIIYALPTVYQRQNSESTADIGKLVSLFLIVQKYHFEAHEKWARGLLRSHCRRIHVPNVQNYFLTCPPNRLENFMRQASEVVSDSHGSPFHESVSSVWQYRLQTKPEESISTALRVAEELGNRKFQALLYYIELLRMKPCTQEPSVLPNPCICLGKDLAPHHSLALYRGYWSLQQYWTDTVRYGLRHRFSCPATHICNREWKRIWRDYRAKMLEIPFDPIQILDDMQNDLIGSAEIPDMAIVACAETMLETMANRLNDNLCDHFIGSA